MLFVLVRLLSVSDYGAYTVSLGIVFMVKRLSGLGLLQSAQYFVPRVATSVSRSDRFRFILMLVTTRCATLLLSAILLALIWKYIAPLLKFSPEQVKASITIAFLVIFHNTLGYLDEILQALMEQRRAWFATALYPVLRLGTLGTLYLLGTRDYSLGLVLRIDTGASAVCSLLAVFMLFSCLRTFPEASEQPPPFREVVRHALHMTGTILQSIVLGRGAIRMIVAHFLGLNAAGLFSFIQQIATLVFQYVPATLLLRLIRPMLISRFKGENRFSLLRSCTNILWKSNLVILGGAFVVLAIAGNAFLDITSGGKFTTGSDSLLMMFLVLASQAQRTLMVMVMQITSQTKELFRTTSIMPLGLLPLCALAPQGLFVVISCLWIISAAWNVTAMWTVRKHYTDFKLDWNSAFQIGIAAVIGLSVGLPLVELLGTTIWNLVLAGTAASIIYVLIVALMRPLRADEFDILRRAIGPTLSRRLAFIARANTNA